MDQEMIRKAAASMWAAFQKSLDISPENQMPFENVGRDEQKNYLRNAEAALTVFYEHTRAQKRERHGVACPDCNAIMNPAAGMPPNSGHYFCANCGKTV